MVFEVYVAGPLTKPHEREQMKDLIYALNANFGPKDEIVRLIVDIRRDFTNRLYKQIDSILIRNNRLFILELKNFNGDITIQFDPELFNWARDTGEWGNYYKKQKLWLINGEVPEEMDENPLDQVREQRRKLITFILDKIKNDLRTEEKERKNKGKKFEDIKEEDPRYRLGNMISGYIVVRESKISYSTEEAKNYVQSQRWLDIIQMDDLINKINYEGVPGLNEIPVLTDNEFQKLINIIGAEKRPFHRWSTTSLESEYIEISRVPSLDFLFESDNSVKIIEAMKGAYKFGLKAYKTDISDVYYRIENEKVKENALKIMINWKHPKLEDILIYALRKENYPSLQIIAINYLGGENEYPKTLHLLEKILKKKYSSKKIERTIPMVLDAIGNVQSNEAGKIIYNFFREFIGEDYYSEIINQIEEIESKKIHQSLYWERKEVMKFHQEIFSKTTEKLSICRYTKATDSVYKLLFDFPVDHYLSINKELYGEERSKDYMLLSRQSYFLDRILEDLSKNIGNIWDGRDESEIIKKIEKVYEELISEETDWLIGCRLYQLYLKALVGIGSQIGLNMLCRHMDSLPPISDDMTNKDYALREDFIEAIGKLDQEIGYDFLVEKLHIYVSKIDNWLFQDLIILILELLGKSRNPKYVKEIIPFLQTKEKETLKELPENVRHYALRALANLDPKNSFDLIMNLFIKEPHWVYNTVRNILNNSDSNTKEELSTKAEELLLEKFEKSTLYPGSRESYIWERVVSEKSLPYLFKLAENYDWYHYPLPQRIGDFVHIEWVEKKVLEFLESKNDYQRAFAIEMIAGSGHWGNKTDKIISKYKADSSFIVKQSVLDYYSYIKKNSKDVASFFTDPDDSIRAYAFYKLNMISHSGGGHYIVISNSGWIGEQIMIFNEDGIFFSESENMDIYHLSKDDDIDLYQPFYIANDKIEQMFVWYKGLKLKNEEEGNITGLYLEEKGKDSLRLLIIPFSKDKNDLDLDYWEFEDHGFKRLISTFSNVNIGEETDYKKAEELFSFAEEQYFC